MEISGPYLTINLKNLEHNLNLLRSKLKKTTEVIPVIKADGYGSNAIVITKKLISLGIKRFAVASTKEGIELRNAGIKNPIMIFYPYIKNFKLLFENKLEPVLYSNTLINAAIKYLSDLKITNYPVHIKFNTGLNRIGLSINEFDLSNLTPKSKCFKILSIYSHLGASENPRPCKYTSNQISEFEKIKKITSEIVKPEIGFHILNTSGIFNYPEKQYDAIRSGIGLYGYANCKDWDFELKPVLTLKAPIIQILKIKKGESVGYNNAWASKRNTAIAILPVGHADGITRSFGNKKIKVDINGFKCPIIGNICMDIIMIDVTNSKCKEGDFVTIFGESNSASFISEQAGTISYELLTGLSQRILRKIIE